MTTTFPLVLDLSDEIAFSGDSTTILGQLDSLVTIRLNGPPMGVQAANQSGVFCWDYANKALYLCLQTDGTVGGTTWQAIIFSFSSATTTQLGLVELATSGDASAGTDTSKALTSAVVAGLYARSGNNADITQLTGLTTPVSASQGGTQLNSPGAAGNILISTGTAYESLPLYGSGADGGLLTTSQLLTYIMGTRFIVTGSPLLTLPTPNAAYYGFKFSFKNTGSGAITWEVQDGSMVEGSSTYSDSAYISNGKPCTDIELRNGAWWIV